MSQRELGRNARDRWPLKLLMIPLAVLLTIVVGAVLVGGALLSGGGHTDEEFLAFVHRSDRSLTGYQAALRASDAFAVVPCYCGCEPAIGHVNLMECFVSADGSFDDHASNCYICLE